VAPWHSAGFSRFSLAANHLCQSALQIELHHSEAVMDEKEQQDV
jgi:hypothetical protein